MNHSIIYLDNCATTRMDPQAVDAMLPFFTEHYGNAASGSHAFGWDAQEAVRSATSQIAALIGADEREIVLTSGATESNNLAIKGFANANCDRGRHIITCVTEHKSILDSCAHLEHSGFEVTYLDVDQQGRISLEQLESSIRPDTILVSLMAVNNETGTIHPLQKIGEICKRHHVTFHVDATQAAGKIPLAVHSLHVDMLSFSAHKLYGPKGIAALYIRRQKPRLLLQALQHGGGHQQGLRSGTLPVPLIVGFGKACELAAEALESETAQTSRLRDRLETRILSRISGCVVNGDCEHRSPIVSNISFLGVDGEELLTDLSGIAVSSGSACTSVDAKPSYVLTAMGRSAELARASLRMSVGRFTTVEEVDAAAEIIIRTILNLRLTEPVQEDAGELTACM
jgi:cysteine desulfurase